MQTIPAILIGGPPHSGKSVLLYGLSQALRARHIEHYALRACPDGEGDWANEAAAPLVRTIRIRGEWTDAWVDQMCRDIAQRHLPLLVDIGGKPTTDQRRIFDECTGAVLLTKDERTHTKWQQWCDLHGLPLLADLTSTLDGDNRIETERPILSGDITGLDRSQMASGPVFEALVALLTETFGGGPVDYRSRHLASAPTEIALDLDRLAVTLGLVAPGDEVYWQPQYLPQLLEYLPAGVELAVYGRGANWLQVALACLAYPAAYHSFDVRLGWVQAQRLPHGDLQPDAPLQFRQTMLPDAVHLETLLPQTYLDYTQLPNLAIPPLPPDRGVILSGKLPYWLYTSLAISVIDAPWVAVYQPPLKAAVIVKANDPARIGAQVSL